MGSYLSTNSAPKEMVADVKTLVDDAIANNRAVVFSKTWCPVRGTTLEITGLERLTG